MQKTIIVVLAISAIFAQSPATNFIPTVSSMGDYNTGERYTNGSVDDLRYGRNFIHGNQFLPIAPGSSSNINPNASNVFGTNGFNGVSNFNGVNGVNGINGINGIFGINGILNTNNGSNSYPYTNYAVIPSGVTLGANGVYTGPTALEIEALNGFNTFGGIGSKYGVVHNNIANNYGYNNLYALNNTGLVTPDILNANISTNF